MLNVNMNGQFFDLEEPRQSLKNFFKIMQTKPFLKGSLKLMKSKKINTSC